MIPQGDFDGILALTQKYTFYRMITSNLDKLHCSSYLSRDNYYKALLSPGPIASNIINGFGLEYFILVHTPHLQRTFPLNQPSGDHGKPPWLLLDHLSPSPSCRSNTVMTASTDHYK